MTMPGRRLHADERGSAAVEFALVVPFMLAVAVGSFELFKLTQATLRANYVAQTVADYVALQPTALSTSEMTDACNGGKLVMAPLPSTGLKVAVGSVKNSGGSRTLDWHDETCGSPTALGSTEAIGLATDETPSSGTSAIVVKVTYNYQSPKSYLLPASRTVTASFVAKPRNGGSVSR